MHLTIVQENLALIFKIYMKLFYQVALLFIWMMTTMHIVPEGPVAGSLSCRASDMESPPSCAPAGHEIAG